MIINGLTKRKLSVMIIVAVVFMGLVYFSTAAPEGATIIGTPTVDDGPDSSPQSRNDSGGEIITIVLSLEQQDTAWKAYVGNVSGRFVLRNSNNYSVYEWPAMTEVSGELYISRNQGPAFGSVVCATNAQLVTEQTFFGMASTDGDSINNTFNDTAHKPFSVGTSPISENTCRSIATWVNGTEQTPSSSALFQEVALYDGSNIIYAAMLNNDKQGFDNSSIFDFQAIVAENRTSSTGTTYYFFIELGS